MYKIVEVKILGVTRLVVDIATDNIETIRREWARVYRVPLGKVKFVYEERE